jgi:hypothetical protein
MLMRTVLLLIVGFLPKALAFDEFNLQMSRVLHEETSWSRDIYTSGTSADLWKSKCPWLQRPAVSVRFNATHQELAGTFVDADLFAPMASVSFQTYGGLNVGLAYAHGFVSEEPVFLGFFGPSELKGDSDSIGGYVGKQWDCGFKAGATVAYTSAELRFQAFDPFYEFDTVGASGALGFARSFGEKKFGKNIFVDTSANFLYQSEDESWHFIWMAKVGHNFCKEFAVYGIFNLFHELKQRDSFGVTHQFSGYHPSRDETWGEAGGGFQARLGRGLSFTAEATAPVLDEYIARNAFQVRAALNWSF